VARCFVTNGSVESYEKKDDERFVSEISFASQAKEKLTLARRLVSHHISSAASNGAYPVMAFSYQAGIRINKKQLTRAKINKGKFNP